MSKVINKKRQTALIKHHMTSVTLSEFEVHWRDPQKSISKQWNCSTLPRPVTSLPDLSCSLIYLEQTSGLKEHVCVCACTHKHITVCLQTSAVKMPKPSGHAKWAALVYTGTIHKLLQTEEAAMSSTVKNSFRATCYLPCFLSVYNY